MDIWISGTDSTEVTLEMADIHRVEPDDCNEQTNVRFRQGITDEIFLFTIKDLLDTVQTVEYRDHGLFICFLCSSETGFVNPIFRRKSIITCQ